MRTSSLMLLLWCCLGDSALAQYQRATHLFASTAPPAQQQHYPVAHAPTHGYGFGPPPSTGGGRVPDPLRVTRDVAKVFVTADAITNMVHARTGYAPGGPPMNPSGHGHGCMCPTCAPPTAPLTEHGYLIVDECHQTHCHHEEKKPEQKVTKIYVDKSQKSWQITDNSRRTLINRPRTEVSQRITTRGAVTFAPRSTQRQSTVNRESTRNSTSSRKSTVGPRSSSSYVGPRSRSSQDVTIAATQKLQNNINNQPVIRRKPPRRPQRPPQTSRPTPKPEPKPLPPKKSIERPKKSFGFVSPT